MNIKLDKMEFLIWYILHISPKENIFWFLHISLKVICCNYSYIIKKKKKYQISSYCFLWQIDGETMETVTDFIFGGSKITADGDCSHEIKRRLFLGRKAMTNLDSILKSRDITLPTKVCLVKAMVFPVVSIDVRVGL